MHNEKLLLVKRRPDDVHKPGVWEIPGGRLDYGENPFDGLKREVLEEVGLKIDTSNPLRIHHFVREDGQKITMIVFLCSAETTTVELSEEHVEFDWVPIEKAKEKVVEQYFEEIDIYRTRFQKSI